MNFRKDKILQSLFFIAGDAIAIFSAFLFTYLILDSLAFVDYTMPLFNAFATVILSTAALGTFRMYQVNWKFTSLRELLFITMGLATGMVAFLAFSFAIGIFTSTLFYYSLLSFMVSILFVGSFRISNRMINEVLKTPVLRKRAIIFGAGNAADQLMRDLMKHHHKNMNIVGIFDDNEALHGLNLHGSRIIGDRKKMLTFLRYNDIDELIIAIPSLPKPELKSIIEQVHDIISNLKIKVLPSLHLLTDDIVGFRNIRQISIEDVLGREPARTDIKSLSAAIKGKTVMITGAGGSIGSEMVRQCLSLEPKKIIALDVDETELFYLRNEYAHLGHILEPCVANITDLNRIRQIFEKEVPDIIFHAAAYKHVPMMEQFPEEAIKVNIGGTRLISKMACEFGVAKFILISTDKAVNPTNVMGATKRVAEEICISYNSICKTKFMAVRFGNVLGSRGSVVPLFMEQIRSGGPITITHKDIVRYFMTIPEAVLLVMQAGMMGNGGEVFVLDMGEPVKIDDMARQLIRLHGLEPDRDIAIEYTGLRPGEKMFEELLVNEEKLVSTSHALIRKASCQLDYSHEDVENLVENLLYKVQNGSVSQARLILKEIVPNYTFKINSDYLIRETIG